MANGTKSNKAVRMHSFVTYANETQVHSVIKSHQNSIRSFAYIIHDKDKNDLHIHLLVRTYDAWTPKQICKWFNGLTDNDGRNVNTFDEPIGDLMALHTYIQHKDEESIQNGKAQYDASLIKDFGLFAELTEKDSYDDTYEIINSMIKGIGTRALVRRYGKKFIYHYSQFIAVKEAIEREDYYEYERTRPTNEQLPYGWRREYNAPDHAINKNLIPDNQKPIPLDNISLDDILK